MTFYAGATGAGWIVPKKYVEKVGDDGFKKAPIGAGPYKFVSFTPGVELVLEASEHYWRKTLTGKSDERVKRKVESPVLQNRSRGEEVMMRKLVRSGAMLTMFVVALSLGPTAARADKPVITKQRYEYTQVVLTCPDFDVLQDESVLLINSIFYANGQYVRNEVISRTHIDYINAVTGKSLSGMAVVTHTFTPDGISSAGLFLRITVPGQGAEALEAGRVVTDATGQVVFERGPFDSTIDLCGGLE